jgi:hypothetical protein
MASALLAELPQASSGQASSASAAASADQARAGPAPVVYGDAAYGTGALLADLDQCGVTAMTKVAAPTAPAGHVPKDRFHVDLRAGTVTCPARRKVPILPAHGGDGWPASAAPVPSARCGPPAPAAEPAAPSPSTRTRRTCRRPEVGSGIRAWRADYRAPPWSASSPTCCAAATAAAAPGRGAWCESGRTGGCWPPRSTWPAWLPWASATDRAAGPWRPPEPQSGADVADQPSTLDSAPIPTHLGPPSTHQEPIVHHVPRDR